MILKIKDKEYEVHFGIAFVRELDKKHAIELKGGGKFGLGLETVIPKLLSDDVITLAEVLYEGTAAEKGRPSQKDIDVYVDNVEDIDALFEEVIDELKKANATKKKTLKMAAEILEYALS